MGITLNFLNMEVTAEIEHSWAYIAPELDYITLDGGLTQWSDFTPISITLDNVSMTGETFQIQAYFAYYGSILYIGLLIPKTSNTVYGAELVFIGNNGTFDGIIIDSELMEGRDVTYLNTTHIAYDSDLGSIENVNVSISDEGDDEFYMIAKETRYPEGNLEGSWEFDEGDSVAVVFQLWVNKIKTNTNRPNFSTGVFKFNYLRLSIKYNLNHKQIELHNSINPGKYNSSVIRSLFTDELDFVLDGKKDESFWEHATSFKIINYLNSKSALNSIQNSVNPDSINVTCTFANDHDNFIMHLEIQKLISNSTIGELSIVFGIDENCLYNLNSQLLICRIRPSVGACFISELHADIRNPGIISDIPSDDFIILSSIKTWNIQGLEYESFGTFGDSSVEGVEVNIPILSSAQADIPPLISPESSRNLYIADLTLSVNYSYPSDPRSHPFSYIRSEDGQLRFTIHQIDLSENTFEIGKIDYNLPITIVVILASAIIAIGRFNRNNMGAKLD